MTLGTYTLTAEDADRINAGTGVAVDGDGNWDGAYAEEGQEYPCVDLPTGTTLVFVDADTPLRVETPDRSVDDDYADDYDDDYDDDVSPVENGVKVEGDRDVKHTNAGDDGDVPNRQV